MQLLFAGLAVEVNPPKGTDSKKKLFYLSDVGLGLPLGILTY